MTMPSWYREALTSMERIHALEVFFIVGCQKSGTSWLQHALNAHPHIACAGEGHFADRLAPLLQRACNQYNEDEVVIPSVTSDDFHAATRLVIDRLLDRTVAQQPNPAEIRSVGDKTPETAVSLDAMSVLYPEARFVHIIRDGRDGAVSGWAQLRRMNRQGQFDSFAHYAAHFARHHWTTYIQAARAAGASIPERYLEVRYERLHAHPEHEFERILRFLGQRHTAADVSACVEGGSFERLTGGRARGEEHIASHFRKGVAGDWVNHFDAEAMARFEAAAGELLRALDYVSYVEA